MSDNLGSVCDVQGDKVSFFLKKDLHLSFGQIVKIDSNGSDFYARVVNAQSKSTLDTGEQLREADGKEAFGPYSSYKSVEAMLFLESKAGRVRSPIFNPNYMDTVYPMNAEDAKMLRLAGELEIGNLRSGGETLGSVGVDINAIPRMMGMFGMTGSGKTNAELMINAHIIDNSPRTAGLIFDFAGQLLEGKELGNKGLCNHPLFHSKVSFYSTKEEKMRVGLRTLQPWKLRNLYSDITDPQYRLAQKLHRRFGDEWIEKTCEKYELSGPSGVAETVPAHKGTINALLQKLTHLDPRLFPPSKYSFIDQVTKDITQGVTCLVDISGVTVEEQRHIVCLTASGVSNYYKRSWESDYERWLKLPTLLITLEEAHEFLDPTRERTIFSDIALTYRKYRVGINAVTPRPSRVNPDVFAELWTKLVMKTELKADRDFLTRNTPYLEYSDTEIKMLDIGEALLISEPKIRFAVPVKVKHYPGYLANRETADYDLPQSDLLEKLDKRLKKLQHANEDSGIT
ncbi:MAG: ATP-binding protein [Candidatus Bathyarchaeota archaeon]|jgi:DNA helicase HerA-like ATPase|nr:MAG: ATP-binding protein [Candidatus Bathyarchaeota archaeon]